MTTQPHGLGATGAVERDFLFEQTSLVPEAYQYSFYMSRYGVNKARAKQLVRRAKEEVIWVSGKYQVNVTPISSPAPFGPGKWLSVKRFDKEPLENRHILGRIMRVLVPGSHGYELFPAPDRLVDTSNQFHLWTFESPCLFEHGHCESWRELAQGVRSAGLVNIPEEMLAELQALRVSDESGQSLEDWRALQNIKEQYFPGCEAVMVHTADPAQALNEQLVVLRDHRARWPFGFRERLVAGPEAAEAIGARQREFEPKA